MKNLLSSMKSNRKTKWLKMDRLSILFTWMKASLIKTRLENKSQKLKIFMKICNLKILFYNKMNIIITMAFKDFNKILRVDHMRKKILIKKIKNNFHHFKWIRNKSVNYKINEMQFSAINKIIKTKLNKYKNKIIIMKKKWLVNQDHSENLFLQNNYQAKIQVNRKVLHKL